MTQLSDLAVPFPSKYVHTNPSGGGSYVKQHAVKQRLLLHLGGYDFELVEIVRGFVPGKAPNPNGTSKRAKEGTPDLVNAVVGVVWRLTVEIDGERRVIEDVGDCEEPHNWPHDGARLKDAVSDALKRCAMHTGLGLHLWAQDEYFLRDKLKEREASTANAVSVEPDAALPANGSGSGDTSPPASPEPSTPGEAPPAASGVERVRAGSAALPPAADPPTAVKQRAEKLAAAKKKSAPHDPSEPRERGE